MMTMARVSLAVARFAEDRDCWPQRLEDLVPAYLPSVPLDPWSRRPLTLDIRGGEAVISASEMDEAFKASVSDSQFKTDEWRVWTVKRREVAPK